VLLFAVTHTAQPTGLSTQIATWLDDEWRASQLEEVHRGIGDAAGAAYVRARAHGTNEVGDILLAVSTSLLDHDFTECGYEVVGGWGGVTGRGVTYLMGRSHDERTLQGHCLGGCDARTQESMLRWHRVPNMHAGWYSHSASSLGAGGLQLYRPASCHTCIRHTRPQLALALLTACLPVCLHLQLSRLPLRSATRSASC
jgi:hypothetical protein